MVDRTGLVRDFYLKKLGFLKFKKLNQQKECDDSECPSPELKSDSRLDDDVFHNTQAEKSGAPLIRASEDLGGHGHSHGHGGHGHSHGGVAMVGWMVILGDGLHNFADGLGSFHSAE